MPFYDIITQEQAGSSAPSIVHPIPAHEVLPTFNRTNKFTKAFQHIIDAYGTANYKEINPSRYPVIQSIKTLNTIVFTKLISLLYSGHKISINLYVISQNLQNVQNLFNNHVSFLI